MNLKQTIKRSIPVPVWDVLRKTYSGVTHLPDLPSAYLHPWRRESIRRLAELKNRHCGERAFIIGNGPSLKQTDLSKLKNETTFGLNRIYLMFPELGFQTSYFVTVNDLVIEQCRDDICALTMPKFLSWRTHPLFTAGAAPATFLYTTYDNPSFATNVSRRVWESATVTYVALQIAFHMGFQQVILVGVDHRSSVPGKANTTIVSQGDDPNHFNPAYFGKGFRWQLPDFETSEIGYRLAHQEYEAHGRQVLDATIDGGLTIFPKVDYSTLFQQAGT